MARLSFPTSREIPCPLLIDEAQLEALDGIIDRYEDPLRATREKDIDAATEKMIQQRLMRGLLKPEAVDEAKKEIRQSAVFYSSRLQRETRSATIYLKGGKEVQAARFSEVISQPLGDEETPVGLASMLAIGRVTARVRLNDRQWQSALLIEVEPNDLEVAQTLFGTLNNWASGVQAGKWAQKWLSLRPIVGAGLVFWLFVAFIFVPLMSWQLGGQRGSRIEARKLLSKGLSHDDELRAIELILAIESRYDVTAGQAPVITPRYWAYATLCALILAIVLICPSVCIGVWKGKQDIRRWRIWIKSVTVTVPLLVVSGALVPWILHWLGLSPPTP